MVNMYRAVNMCIYILPLAEVYTIVSHTLKSDFTIHLIPRPSLLQIHVYMTFDTLCQEKEGEGPALYIYCTGTP